MQYWQENTKKLESVRVKMLPRLLTLGKKQNFCNELIERAL